MIRQLFRTCMYCDDVLMNMTLLCFSGLSYKYIVIQQPIGRQLFRMYCDTKSDLKKAISFLDEIVSLRFLAHLSRRLIDELIIVYRLSRCLCVRVSVC